VYSIHIHFLLTKSILSLFEPPFEELGVTYTLHPELVGKRMANVLFTVIEPFSLALTVETLSADIGQSRRFSEAMGHFERKF